MLGNSYAWTYRVWFIYIYISCSFNTSNDMKVHIKEVYSLLKQYCHFDLHFFILF